ncbi:MAG TPA: glutathione S-transferase family protein [Solirubrobacterales bacterium]|nr:glutathione S-transferase family protein [Solirubrobacterales bacterium]
MTHLPTLWQYSFSHFNEKARWALDHKRIPHRRWSLLPGGPRAMWFSVRGTLPVLDLDGERIVDSTRIIAALEERQPEHPLYPEDAGARERALELEEFFDEEMGHDVRRVAFFDWDARSAAALMTTAQPSIVRVPFRATLPVGMRTFARTRFRIYPDDVEESRGKILAALDRIEAELGSGEYLVSERFSVADLTACALLYPLAWPDEVQYDPPRPHGWEFRDRLADRPALVWVRETYRRHRGSSASVSG